MHRDLLRKGIPILAVLVVLSIIGFGIFKSFSPERPANQPNHSTNPTNVPPPTPENKPPFTVQRGDVTREISLTGQISSAKKQELFFRTRGPIDKILVKKNDQVKIGQLLANIYLSKIQFDLQRAQINLDIDKLNLSLEQLQPKPFGPNTQPINLAIKQKEIDLATVNIQDINSTIADMQIVSPMDGTVTAVYFKEGDQTNGFEPVVQIADLRNLEVEVNLLSEDLTGLTINTPVTMHPIKHPDEVIDGVISAFPVTISANTPSQNSDDFIHISLNGKSLPADDQYGDQVQVLVVVERKNNVLWLPPTAITTTGGHSYVTIKDDERQHEIEVKLGLQTDRQVEILSGVKEGQGVYLPY